MRAHLYFYKSMSLFMTHLRCIEPARVHAKSWFWQDPICHFQPKLSNPDSNFGHCGLASSARWLRDVFQPREIIPNSLDLSKIAISPNFGTDSKVHILLPGPMAASRNRPPLQSAGTPAPSDQRPIPSSGQSLSGFQRFQIPWLGSLWAGRATGPGGYATPRPWSHLTVLPGLDHLCFRVFWGQLAKL